MKKMKKSFLIFSFLIFVSFMAFSQENTKISPYISLQYFKDNDENSYLKTTLTYSMNRMEVPLQGMKIILSSGKAKNVLIEASTDEKGVGTFKLENKSDFSSDENGLWPFNASFAGNDSIDAVAAEILIRNASLIMDLTEIDSVKTINLTAQKLENGKMVPASGELLTVYVPRMFSLLPIGEATLDDSGKASIEFPADLPGDKEGNLSIIAKFEEHPDFGNIEKTITLKWGLPQITSDRSSHRALWTKTAPKWMIYTLSFLLAGVWGHYLFVIISLIRIKIESNRNKEKEYFIK